MENEKDMSALADEIVAAFAEANGKKEEGVPENAVRLEMTPDKIPFYAKLFPREMVEKSVGTFISSMVMQFYGWDGKGEPELLKRSRGGDEQAAKIVSCIHLLAEVISCDLKGEQYDWDDEEDDS